MSSSQVAPDDVVLGAGASACTSTSTKPLRGTSPSARVAGSAPRCERGAARRRKGEAPPASVSRRCTRVATAALVLEVVVAPGEQVRARQPGPCRGSRRQRSRRAARRSSAMAFETARSMVRGTLPLLPGASTLEAPSGGRPAARQRPALGVSDEKFSERASGSPRRAGRWRAQRPAGEREGPLGQHELDPHREPLVDEEDLDAVGAEHALLGLDLAGDGGAGPARSASSSSSRAVGGRRSRRRCYCPGRLPGGVVSLRAMASPTTRGPESSEKEGRGREGGICRSRASHGEDPRGEGWHRAEGAQRGVNGRRPRRGGRRRVHPACGEPAPMRRCARRWHWFIPACLRTLYSGSPTRSTRAFS